MMRPCIVDTSSWIEALRSDGDSLVRDRVSIALRNGRARLTEIVLLELWNGARGEQEKAELERLQHAVPLLRTTEGVWGDAVDCARALRSAGVTVPATDILVFAAASHHGADLEHCDSHFDVIRKVQEEG